MTEEKTFKEFGRQYQEKVIQALFEDHYYAEMMAEVLEPEYFTLAHLQLFAKKFFEYRRQYKDFPSLEVVSMQITQDDSLSDDLALQSVTSEFLTRIQSASLNGDAKWIQESSLEFCKRQCIIGAIGKAVVQIEGKNYDSIANIVRDALNRGLPKDQGHEYMEEMDKRCARAIRKPISTGWPVLDKYLNGGWEKKTLCTFIAPTGAGKSMFLVNAACALVEQGYNVLYTTLEMADYKIGLRADSWYSGVSINEVHQNKQKVQDAINARAKGRLIIKEWPTKRASVDTIRGHIERLKQMKNFKIDALVLDYADLLRSSRVYGEKRHELEGVYEELRGLAQELDIILITADQTNRGGLDQELVTLNAIAESYAKATVCDLIMTISRTMEDKLNGTGRLYVAKSRLGEDGMVLPFTLKTATVRADIMDANQDPIATMLKMNGTDGVNRIMKKTAEEVMKQKRDRKEDGN